MPRPIDRVGIASLKRPIVVRDQARGWQHAVADITMSVDLPARFKGTHMSRFVEALEAWGDRVDYHGFRHLLEDLSQRLDASRSHLAFSFPYFMALAAPVSGSRALMDCQCRLSGTLGRNGFTMTLGVEVPVMTVCPCSLAISSVGAHSQRALVNMLVTFSGFLWIEDLAAIGRESASSPVFALLKREDEKKITESAFDHPCFVEDVVRAAAQRLEAHPLVKTYRVEVESLESIHNHNAFASIAGPSGNTDKAPRVPNGPEPL
ncbi:MAG: GTP cyclohydrolase I FolE2 [Deltaproteobacteria bacterium]|nr:GTP cyclohydrolase I FolE2 [Deltaproteobacteria bacterium]